MNLKFTSLLFLIPLFSATISSSGAAYGNCLLQHKGENGTTLSIHTQNEHQNITFENLDKVEANNKIHDNLKKSGGGGHGRGVAGGGFGGGTAGGANHHAMNKSKNGGSVRQRPFSLVVILSLAYAFALSL
ncbi:hypothetical protein KSS87_023705 [Heliosperma pusillum]|nr:hypothetical protein KSS87_023705 [Heliosperma pusillum]